jgi:hypothetical protein
MLKHKFFILCGLLAITSAYAFGWQHSMAKFSSVYTDLNKQCKAALKESEIGEGQDMPQNCKGYGGYRISIGYSAMYAHLIAETLDGKHSIPLTTAQINYDMEKGRKIEWRMANGKPFAVILRVEDKLLVKGLRGYEKIDYDIDTKTTPNPNQQAREMADKAYLQ